MKTNGYNPIIRDTPRVLRARIETRLELLKGEDPESHRYVVGLQRIAELERQLDKMEGTR